MPRPRDLAALGGHGDLEAVGNPSGLPQEDGRCGRRADVGRGLLEQCQPAVEVLRPDRQRKMGLHRLTVVAAGHQDSPHTDADSHFVVPDIDTFAKIEGDELRSLTISRSRLNSFEVSSSGGNTKGRIAYLSGAQAEGPL